MATLNPFDLLGDGETEDPSAFIAAQELKLAAAAAAAAAAKKAPLAGAGAKKVAPADPVKGAKFPNKPQPPSQAARETRNETVRGGGGHSGRGYGRGRGPSGPNKEFGNDENTFSSENGTAVGYKEDRERPYERRGGYGGPRGGFRGGQRGGFGNGEADGERPRRVYDRRSGTGHGGDIKRDGAGRGNWGTAADEIAQETEVPAAEGEPNTVVEKKPEGEENGYAEKENEVNETEEKDPEEKQMTLEEYEKVLEEKRKALQSMKVEERKVDVKEFESMQIVSKKNTEEEIFIKLGSEKDKRKEAAEKEERAKKSMSINEFLKPAEGEHYRAGGRGRGRGGRSRDGGYGARNSYSYVGDVRAPSIQDPSQFPSLAA